MFWGKLNRLTCWKSSGVRLASVEDIQMDARIVCDPEILRGKPTVAGTRISGERILEKLTSDYSTEDLLESFPNLTREGIQAALQFSLDVLRNEVVYPLAC